MIRRLSQTIKKLSKLQIYKMCVKATSEEAPTGKSYRMPEKKEIIPYKTQFPLRMHNYRVLIYANKQNLFTPALRQTLYAVPFVLLIHLIRSNPWYLTFPASLPIMMGVQIFVFYKWIMHKKYNKYVIQRVYVYQSNFVEFVFSNKLRRKFKGLQDSHTFHDPLQLVTPRQGLDGEIEWKERGFPFPTSLVYFKNQKTNEIQCYPPYTPLGYGWNKYCDNFQNYVFPKKYEYANWQLLVNLFNGLYIDFSDSTNQIEQLPQGEDYSPLEKELEWIKEDKLKDQQLRKKRQENKDQSA